MKLGKQLLLSLFMSVTGIVSAQDIATQKDICAQLQLQCKYPKSLLADLNKHGVLQQQGPFVSQGDIPLFSCYPLLKNSLPYISLGTLPTPIVQLDVAGKELGLSQLYIKLDSLTGAKDDHDNYMYGGNKVRKLEFLLADALAHDATTVMTFGCAGSNHALATAVYAQRLGLNCICLLKPQDNSHVVQNNLKMHMACGTNLHYYPAQDIRTLGTVITWLQEKNSTGKFPYIIPTGGSCPLGAIGFVNAAFELKQQIDAGTMPEPDRIYIPCGSCGSTAGLILGCKLAGLKTKIVPVAVESESRDGAFKEQIAVLMYETNKLLHDYDPTVPLLTMDDVVIEINMSSHGAYGVFTQEGAKALEIMKKTEGFMLEGTYTAKAFAGLMYDVQNGIIQPHEVILFWNTYCGIDFSEQQRGLDYKNLPICFHTFFETPVQELDRHD